MADDRDGQDDGTPRNTLRPGIANVVKRLHRPLDLMLWRVQWHVA